MTTEERAGVKAGDKVIVRDGGHFGEGIVNKVTPMFVFLVNEPRSAGIYTRRFEKPRVAPFSDDLMGMIRDHQATIADLDKRLWEARHALRELFDARAK